MTPKKTRDATTHTVSAEMVPCTFDFAVKDTWSMRTFTEK